VTTEQAGAHKRTRTGILMGTPTFMAPEQARAKWSDVDERTDIWAVGAIMFYALAGRPVHVADTVNEILVAASMRPAPSLARFARAPLPVVRIVDKALSFDRKERYPDAQSMIAAIVAAVPEVRAARAQSAASPSLASASRPTACGVRSPPPRERATAGSESTAAGSLP
jgi:serine/threonine-protein kinase